MVRERGLSRNTVRKIIRTDVTAVAAIEGGNRGLSHRRQRAKAEHVETMVRFLEHHRLSTSTTEHLESAFAMLCLLTP